MREEGKEREGEGEREWEGEKGKREGKERGRERDPFSALSAVLRGSHYVTSVMTQRSTEVLF